MASVILLTGATGFLGAHVLDRLMACDYPVLCTVRYLEQGLYFKTRYPHGRLAFVEVPDLCHEGALDHILKNNRNIRYVLHLATPYHDDFELVNCDQQLFEPCEKLVQHVIRSCCSHGERLKSVVVGSCFAAMVNDPPRFDDHGKIYSSRDMSCISKEEAVADKFHALIGAMTFAEQAAWSEYDDTCPDFSLMMVFTPMLLGPPINDTSTTRLSPSLRLLYDLITKSSSESSTIDPFPFPFYLDVRDAAQALINAINICEPETGRFFVCANNISSHHLVDIARQSCPHLASRLPVARKGGGELELANQCGFDRNENSVLFKTTFRTLEETIIDSFSALIALEAADELRDIPAALTDLSLSPAAHHAS